MKLDIHLEVPEVRTGRAIRGRVDVISGGHSRALTAHLHQRDRTSRCAATLSTISQVLHEGDLAPPASFDFAFDLPADAVPSFKGEHGEIFWEVDVRADVVGRDVHARRTVIVTPVRA